MIALLSPSLSKTPSCLLNTIDLIIEQVGIIFREHISFHIHSVLYHIANYQQWKNAITAEIESVEGVKFLDVDPGWDTNRTVITFVGSPETVLKWLQVYKENL